MSTRKTRGETLFTPTQQKIIDMLSDGLPHTKRELHECLYDETGPLLNIAVHICTLRKILEPFGQTIVCRVGRGQNAYQHVILLKPSSAE